MIIRSISMVNPIINHFCCCLFEFDRILSQLLAMDASARISMKDAAKCDKHCEWQNSANQ